MEHGKEQVTIVNGKRRRTRVEVYAFNDEGKLLSWCGMAKYPELPGGGVDEGENAIQAAVREAMEESGWVVSDCQVVELSEPWIYRDTDKNDYWFVEKGWDEEEEIAVICKAIEFKPNHIYLGATDSMPFELNDVSKVIEGTQIAIDHGEMSGLRLNVARFRLHVLELLKVTKGPNTMVRSLEQVHDTPKFAYW